ncbi:hypothetical protein [Bradyrhizobium sp. 17]|uniref:hypothetical protein n=1 Tax=Bradyrhizobium sp. 17 TaxID=2782649 RepID=UPI001FF81B45|nr:hypothetical protein [Bradyrhizobium sp. 17]MCK1520246.1 hypothetical protein [Bradyrhizobium sp. 17]
MTDTKIQAPNPADFSCNEKPGEYTAKIEVKGVISIPIKAESQEDAQRQAEAELERIEKEGYVEINGIDEIDLQYVTKDRPMYRVTRGGERMQVSHLRPGDLPRDPDPSYGF